MCDQNPGLDGSALLWL